MFQGAIAAMDNNIKIQRRKLFIQGVNSLANPSLELAKNHVTEWLKENPQCAVSQESNDTLIADKDLYLYLTKSMFTHPAFKKIHKLHKDSKWLENKIWLGYDVGTDFYEISRQLNLYEDEVAEPDDPKAVAGNPIEEERLQCLKDGMLYETKSFVKI